VKRIAYLVLATLVTMLVLAPTTLAQQQEDTVPGDDDPYLPEPSAVEVDAQTLQQIAGQPLPETGGPAVGSLLIPAAAALILGSSVVGYAFLRTTRGM
jgi:hypothetical protein